jgi:D-arabinose 1-dehydrogenase-like Zn-dependent alcohol dehydrogenase
MRALVIEQFGRLGEVRDVPEPLCPPRGVVIEVGATGLCRSDWHGWMGHDPDITLPHVPGHELAGAVVAVGAEVRRGRVGDRVTVPFVCACGDCEACRAGEQQVCDRQFQPGFTHWGSFADRVAVDHADVNLVHLPDELDFVTAASLGCRFSTAYRALTVHGRIEPEQWVAVHGCGGVGLSAVMIAVARGARVVAVDVAPAALELAGSFGAEALVNAAETDVVRTIREITGGGAHVSVDALGSVVTCRNSVSVLRKRGRHVQVGLMLAGDASPPVPMDRVIMGELEIYGSHGMSAAGYPALLDDVLAGRVRPRDLVTARITLEESAQALATMDQAPPAGITVIVPAGAGQGARTGS